MSNRGFRHPEPRGIPSLSQLNDEMTPLFGGERFEARSPSTWPAAGLKIVGNTGYTSVSIVLVPFAICAGAAGWQPVTCFVLNLFCIPGLRSVLSFLFEELSARLGQTLGGLLNIIGEGTLDLIVDIPLTLHQRSLT
jgi:Ca2+:H+ antiporter